MVLEQVAFDIETTGFDVDDEVTTVGFAVPMGVRVFLQTGERDASGIESRVDSAVPETLVRVSTHASERELLVAVSEFVAERFRDGDVLLVAYNGERWNGGFDLPFLRTRYAKCELAWPFDVPYADVMPLVTDRFNTTVDGGENGDLVTAYDVLCDGSHGDLDPFTDSKEAVTSFEDGRFAELVLHNVADVLRTRALGRVAERYCSKSEFKVKSLTPTRSI
ncbi:MULTISPECIES: 3'-5' exonuclease [Halorussus]|uniref:3'-5' exonuclease n=1 Tax=Halorussus TaxID=1070314 RepID=UPI000E215A19|nr:MULTISPECIES: 3'-5' exonuclease [Halorussus]NHN58539.1 3'-5' exonuclease [Halorussus sp. JP-T4]